jgi:DNA polymerase III delta' subunit
MATIIHPLTQTQLEAVKQSRSGSFIFHGPAGMGKATVARDLARQVNCLGDGGGLCAHCRQFAADSYPDLVVVKPEDKPSILIDQVRGLAQALSLSLYYRGGLRVVIIDDAHALTIEAQNALLKLIEEPPPHTLFILVTDQIEALVATVRSRCVPVYFPRLTIDEVAALLSATMKPAEARALAATTHGIPGAALTLAANSAEAEALVALAHTAEQLPSQGLFQRLLTAKQLIDTKADLLRLATFMHATMVEQVKSGALSPAAAHGTLSAIEQFRRQLAAKVAPRVALERLLVGLPA